MNTDPTTPAPVFGGVPVGAAAADSSTPTGAPFGAVPVPVLAPPRPPDPPSPAAAPAGPRLTVMPGAIRRRAGLVSLATVLAVPLVLLVAAEAGELDRPDVPVLQSAAVLGQPLTVVPALAAGPAPTPSSTVTAVPVPTPPASSLATDPAAGDGGASEPDAEAVPSTSGGSSKRPPTARPTRPSNGGAQPPAPTPAQPPRGGPVVPLPGGGSGGLCTAAQQAGQLPPALLKLCHSMYGNG